MKREREEKKKEYRKPKLEKNGKLTDVTASMSSPPDD